jgi:hypothetical protein
MMFDLNMSLDNAALETTSQAHLVSFFSDKKHSRFPTVNRS